MFENKKNLLLNFVLRKNVRKLKILFLAFCLKKEMFEKTVFAFCSPYNKNKIQLVQWTCLQNVFEN